ncbi:MAG TPA: hypothetical protein VK553_07285 [Candidatus Nitrosopolaris rasttigaisensis]|nr:hypothetical protein [Candidatus Nitrosopolaris rasttigaisensis]
MLPHRHKRDLSSNTRKEGLPKPKRTAAECRQEAERFSPNPAGSSAMDKIDNQSKQQTDEENDNNPELEETAEKLDKLLRNSPQDFHQVRATIDIDFEKFPKLPEKVVEATNTWQDFCQKAKDNHGTFISTTHSALNAYNLLEYHQLSTSPDKIQFARKFLERYTEMHGRDQVEKAFEAKNFLDAYRLWIANSNPQTDNADAPSHKPTRSESPDINEENRIKEQWKRFEAIKSETSIKGLIDLIQILSHTLRNSTNDASSSIGDTIYEAITLINDPDSHKYGAETNSDLNPEKALDNLFDTKYLLDRHKIIEPITQLQEAINATRQPDSELYREDDPSSQEGVNPDQSRNPVELPDPSDHPQETHHQSPDTKEKRRIENQWEKFTSIKSRGDIKELMSNIRMLAGDYRRFQVEESCKKGEKILKTIILITDKESHGFKDTYGEETDPTPDYAKAFDNLFQISQSNTPTEEAMKQEIANLKKAINEVNPEHA